MNFNHYFSNEELEEVLQRWVAQYPDLASLVTIGESYQKRPIRLLILTNRKTGPDHEKPAVWLDANIHATEISGTTALLCVADALLEGYGSDTQATRLLDNAAYYIVPRINPDGAALAMAEKPRFVRSGVRPYPWPEIDEGLHDQDMDGDGRILQMRIQDPSGDWKVSPLDPRLLEKRLPAEHGGTYYRLLPEGRVEKYDGYLLKIAAPPEGLDFNRNFPFEWRGEGEQSGAGPYPASEPETRALIEFITAHPNINIAITYHTYSRVILRSYSTKSDDEMETGDLWVYKKIGEIGTRMTGYRCVSTFHDFKYHPKEVTTGGFDDWLFDHRGVFAFTIELWDLPDEAGIKERKLIDWFRDHPAADDLKILQWADEHCGGKGFVDWYPFEHPQLGMVELGGWDQMYTWHNPPVELIGAEAMRNKGFALALGELLPKLALHTLEVRPLGEGSYHLNLVVENTGFLPTCTSEQGRKRKIVRPVRLELDLPEGATLTSGRPQLSLGHLEGRSNKLDTDTVGGIAGTDNRARAEWVLKGEPGMQLRLRLLSERAGSFERVIELPA